jgi:hypothetical protein
LETSNKKSGPSFRLFSIEKTKGDMKDAYERSERERERERCGHQISHVPQNIKD